MIGIAVAAVAAPGPSLRVRSSIFLQGLRDSVLADETEVDVHEERDQRRQQEHVNREEPLEGRRTDNGAALQDLADKCSELGGWRGAGDLDRHLGGEVRLVVPREEVTAERKDQDD